MSSILSDFVSIGDSVRMCKHNGHVFTNDSRLKDTSTCPVCDEMKTNQERKKKSMNDMKKLALILINCLPSEHIVTSKVEDEKNIVIRCMITN